MRIIEWNSQGAFRKKNDRILSLRPDILIIPECESENKLKFGDLTPKPTDFFWYGDSENKGIGIFSYSDYKFELLKIFNPRFRFIIPLKVTGKDSSFLLFAIWAMDNKEKPEARYIGQIWLAINYYSNLLSLPCVLTGDFNSNKIWDEKKRVGNHSDMVEFLKKENIFSLYHKQEKIEQGKEIHPTFHMYRKTEKPYHIDYFFASDLIIKDGFEIKVGKAKNWIDLSDHVPLTLELQTKTRLGKLNDLFSDHLTIKLKELSSDSHTRFADLIADLIEKAKKIDNLNGSIESLKKREQLIVKYEKLFEIDKLINELKE
ncbi:exonuclease [Seonamhaeicola sp. S2-3]|uniref:endonuclease/exonuclease/phosphatase family protein n=1 Tax=Seonamhaeicola sp. S2-3 TaxID=1936081 RepID=UPI000972A256|nr:endonuclease/exonuclease/phosphatase family protein [Seonamhaeicola sp. S2-3]APY10525.1 exonuclease [Seonamhaeicola sp. S2-3]